MIPKSKFIEFLLSYHHSTLNFIESSNSKYQEQNQIKRKQEKQFYNYSSCYVVPTGLEPVTLCLEGRCSIQLSYGTVFLTGCKYTPTFSNYTNFFRHFFIFIDKSKIMSEIKIEDIQIEQGWKVLLTSEFLSPNFRLIKKFLKSEKENGKTMFPPGQLIFNAFNLCPLDQLKVVILGQDPYHGPGQAMGLSFSVPQNIKMPPSLKNIYKEIQADLGIDIPSHGDLTYWAKQGVLLLNAILTVESNQPGSHKNSGWEQFTNAVIQKIADNNDNIVFLLWGNFAKAKKNLINSEKHLILESPHPSPLAGKGFFGNHHFSKTNDFLRSKNITPIDWQIT